MYRVYVDREGLGDYECLREDGKPCRWDDDWPGDLSFMFVGDDDDLERYLIMHPEDADIIEVYEMGGE